MIHLIDLSIKIGLRWTGLMQALATRSTGTVELLRITAIGTSKDTTAETGDRLTNFAKSLNLPFAFEEIIVPDMGDLREDMIRSPESGETVVMGTMLDRPECLENLMTVVKRLNPCLMTVTEVDADHNHASFNRRFTEVLFYYSAWFDCLRECMAGSDSKRLQIEAHFMSLGILSMVALERKERAVRNVGMET